MFTRSLVAPLLLLPAVAVQADTLTTLSRAQMQPRQVYEFQTVGRTYRAEVLDQTTGECLVSTSSDGIAFGKPRKAFVLGATRGPQAGITFVLMGEIKIGLGVELAIEGLGKNSRFLTPDVTSISLVGEPPAAAEQKNLQ